MPLRPADLGILNFQYKVALHFLNGALALNDSHSLSLGNSETWSAEVSRAVGFLERVSCIDVDMIAPKQARQGPSQTILQYLYQTSPGSHATACSCLSGMLPRQTPTSLGGAFHLAWATHLGQAHFAPQQRCAYRHLAPDSSAQPHWDNMTFMFILVHIVPTSDGITLFVTRGSPHSKRPVGTPKLNRSCELGKHSMGPRCFHHGHAWSPDIVHVHLECSTTAKASHYVPVGNRHPPDGLTLVPLIYSANHGWFNLEGLGFLQCAIAQVTV